VLALAACATDGVQRSHEERALHAIQGANAAYEEVLLSAGRAYTDGIIGDAQLEQVRTAGRVAEQALRTAKAALEAYLAIGSSVGTAGLDAALADLQEAVTGLLRIWEENRHE
jgi:hypothetical protein